MVTDIDPTSLSVVLIVVASEEMNQTGSDPLVL